MRHALVPAVPAQVEVRAHRAAVALARLDLLLAVVAGAGEGGGIRVVQVVQHHHAAVLGPPQRVKLVVVALAQRQELLHRCPTSEHSAACMPCLAWGDGMLKEAWPQPRAEHPGQLLDRPLIHALLQPPCAAATAGVDGLHGLI